MDILSAQNFPAWTGPSWVILLILPMAAHVDYPAGRSSGDLDLAGMLGWPGLSLRASSLLCGFQWLST